VQITSLGSWEKSVPRDHFVSRLQIPKFEDVAKHTSTNPPGQPQKQSQTKAGKSQNEIKQSRTEAEKVRTKANKR
jgi:hypothetical protein